MRPFRERAEPETRVLPLRFACVSEKQLCADASVYLYLSNQLWLRLCAKLNKNRNRILINHKNNLNLTRRL